MALDLRLLGRVLMRVDGQVVPLPPGRPLALLVALLLGRGRRVSTDRLAAALWDDPPGSAVSNLRTYATRLRHSLGNHSGRLTRVGDGYALAVEPGELDLHRWERGLAEAQRAMVGGSPRAAAEHLQVALAMWEGVAAEDVTRRGAVGRGLDDLDESWCAANERYARACLDSGRYQLAVDRLQPFVSDHPTREVAWHHLMLALFHSGDRVGALAAYARARAALVAEIGVEPGDELQRLQRRLLEDTTGAGTPPAAGPAPAATCTLPPDTDLFGRAAVLAGIVDELSDPARPAIVALHGPPGAGKSALAVRAAWAVAASYPGGRLYIDLRGNSPGLTPMAAPEVLGSLLRALAAFAVGESPGDQVVRLRGLLAERGVLLVLDNAVDAAQVRPLLPAIAGTSAVLTSRRILTALDVGRHVAISELGAAASVSMLARSGGGARVTQAPEDARLLSQLCDHLPLALRIVGARLAGRPDWTLSDMISRLADERHRLDELACDDLAVRSGLALTCGTLAERDGGAQALALFDRWGATGVSVLGLTPARALADGDLHAARVALDRLADARLIEPCGQDLYRMHDLVRIFALERAGRLPADQREAAVHRLRCLYLDAARQARDLIRVNLYRSGDEFVELKPSITFAGKQAAVDWLEAERVNLVTFAAYASREHSQRGDLFACRLSAELYPFLPMRGHYQDWRRLSADALACARRLGSLEDEVVARTHLANAQARTGLPAEAVRTLREALAVLGAGGDARLIATVHDHLGVVLAANGDLLGARDSFQRAIAVHRARPHAHDLGVSLNNLADVHLQLADTAEALRHLQESLKLRRALDDQLGIGITTLTIGQVYAADHRHPQALRWLGRALAAARDHGNREAEWRALTVRAGVHAELGRPERSRADLAGALAVAELIGDGALSEQVRQALDALVVRSGTL